MTAVEILEELIIHNMEHFEEVSYSKPMGEIKVRFCPVSNYLWNFKDGKLWIYIDDIPKPFGYVLKDVWNISDNEILRFVFEEFI